MTHEYKHSNQTDSICHLSPFFTKILSYKISILYKLNEKKKKKIMSEPFSSRCNLSLEYIVTLHHNAVD